MKKEIYKSMYKIEFGDTEINDYYFLFDNMQDAYKAYESMYKPIMHKDPKKSDCYIALYHEVYEGEAENVVYRELLDKIVAPMMDSIAETIEERR